MRTATSIVGACALVAWLAAPVLAGEEPCVGDCDGNGEVGINELILGVNIALELQPIDACQAFDCMGTGTVPISCLIQGVSNSLNGCNGVAPTPTATPNGNETIRTFTLGSNVTFGVGGGCNNCDNQMESCQPCIKDSDCALEIECSPGMDLSRTGIFNGSPLGNTNVLETLCGAQQGCMVGGQLPPITFMIAMGAQDSNGVAPLSLKQDVQFFGDIFGGAGCFCLKLFANGSSGSIDCNGGTPYDTQIFQAAGQGPAWEATTGLGDPSGPGNANLIVNGQLQFVSGVTCATVNCTFPDPPVPFPFTTTKALSRKGTALFLQNHGEAFDCANFGTSGSGGALVSGGAITIDPVGDTADSFRLSEDVPVVP